MTTAKPPLPPDAVAALQRGDWISAIRAIRQAGGLDLQAAKRALEAHAREYAEAQARARGGNAAPATADARQAIREVAAKARVESAARPGPNLALGKRQPTVAMGDRPGETRWLLVAMSAAAGMAWLAFAG